jgi:hypothetical protein
MKKDTAPCHVGSSVLWWTQYHRCTAAKSQHACRWESPHCSRGDSAPPVECAGAQRPVMRSHGKTRRCGGKRLSSRQARQAGLHCKIRHITCTSLATCTVRAAVNALAFCKWPHTTMKHLVHGTPFTNTHTDTDFELQKEFQCCFESF